MDSDTAPIMSNYSLGESVSDIVTCQTNKSFQPDEDIDVLPTNINKSAVESRPSEETLKEKTNARALATVIVLFSVNLFNYMDRFTVAGISNLHVK